MLYLGEEEVKGLIKMPEVGDLMGEAELKNLYEAHCSKFKLAPKTL